MVGFRNKQVNGVAQRVSGKSDKLGEVKGREEVSECTGVSQGIEVNVEVTRDEQIWRVLREK